MTHSCEFENFSGKIFENGGDVDGCLGSNTHLVLGVVLQETLDTTAWKLSENKVSNPILSKRMSVRRNSLQALSSMPRSRKTPPQIHHVISSSRPSRMPDDEFRAHRDGFRGGFDGCARFMRSLVSMSHCLKLLNSRGL
jgi:hypothetical protein